MFPTERPIDHQEIQSVGDFTTLAHLLLLVESRGGGKMGIRRFTILIGLALSTTTSLNAGIVPGRWERVEALEEGYAITVKLDSGERFKASYLGFTDNTIILKRDSGEGLEVPKAAVIKVTSQSRKSNDGLRNGAIIGAVAGGAVGLIVPQVTEGDNNAGNVALSIALFAAMGMGVGVGVDAMVKGREVLYQARGD
jgi:hypothetical protein